MLTIDLDEKVIISERVVNQENIYKKRDPPSIRRPLGLRRRPSKLGWVGETLSVL